MRPAPLLGPPAAARAAAERRALRAEPAERGLSGRALEWGHIARDGQHPGLGMRHLPVSLTVPGARRGCQRPGAGAGKGERGAPRRPGGHLPSLASPRRPRGYDVQGHAVVEVAQHDAQAVVTAPLLHGDRWEPRSTRTSAP